ncbi:MAG TPA: hypothetical protein PKB14_08455 [Rubrivivax sp.]|nr:hypothetical protein [Rubrivivax sp.]
MSETPARALRQWCRAADLPLRALQQAAFSGDEPVLQSSFAVGSAAQASMPPGTHALAGAGIIAACGSSEAYTTRASRRPAR